MPIQVVLKPRLDSRSSAFIRGSSLSCFSCVSWTTEFFGSGRRPGWVDLCPSVAKNLVAAAGRAGCFVVIILPHLFLFVSVVEVSTCVFESVNSLRGAQI
jgi:hypothetical protein